MQNTTSSDETAADSNIVPDLNTLNISDLNDGPVGNKASTSTQGILKEASYESPNTNLILCKPDILTEKCERDSLLRVKTGNGSLVTTHITAELLVDDSHTDVGPPSFFNKYQHDCMNERISFHPSVGYQLISNVERSDSGGYHKIESTVILINPDPIPDSPERHDLIVEQGISPFPEELNMEPVKVLYFPNSNIIDVEHIYNFTRYYSGLSMDDESPLLYALSRHADSCNLAFDNCMIYAKLFYYAYLLDLFAQLNVKPNVDPHQPENEPVWINFNIDHHASSASSELVNLIDEALSSRFILVDETGDFYFSDMNVLRFLTDEGNKISTPSSGPVPHVLYIKWPAIPFAIFSNKPRPAPVDADLVTAGSLRFFAQRLASRRGEWRSLVKGAYIATELMGTRYKKVVVPGEEVPHWWPLRSNLSPDPVSLPCPSDNNFMNRVLGVYPSFTDEIKAEGQAFLSGARSHIHNAVLYNAILSSATSTFLHGMNINTALLKAWGSGEDVPHKFNIRMKNINTNWGQGDHFDREPPIISCPRKAFKIWLGVGVHPELYCSNSQWWGQQGTLPEAKAILHDMDDNTIPHLYNPLCLDNFLLVRPIEWAVLGLDTSLDMRASVRFAPNPSRGWYAHRRSNMYALRSISQEPYKLVVFGAQVLQAIVNMYKFTSSDLPPVSVQTMKCLENDPQVFIDNPVVTPISDSHYDEILNNFNPFTFRSYSWSKDSVLCPALVNEALDSRKLMLVESCNLKRRNNVGIRPSQINLCMCCALSLPHS